LNGKRFNFLYLPQPQIFCVFEVFLPKKFASVRNCPLFGQRRVTSDFVFSCTCTYEQEEVTGRGDRKRQQEEATGRGNRKRRQEEATGRGERKRRQEEAAGRGDKKEQQEEATGRGDRERRQGEATGRGDRKGEQEEATRKGDSIVMVLVNRHCTFLWSLFVRMFPSQESEREYFVDFQLQAQRASAKTKAVEAVVARDVFCRNYFCKIISKQFRPGHLHTVSRHTICQYKYKFS